MTQAPKTDLDQALKALEDAPKTPPGRWEARAVLVPLGLLIQARGLEALSDALERVKAATAPHEEAWQKAILEEVSLACAEHIQGVDPRYLGLANFDWGYLLEARERLEARKIAAEALQMPIPAHLWSQVEAADEQIQPHLPPVEGPDSPGLGDRNS